MLSSGYECGWFKADLITLKWEKVERMLWRSWYKITFHFKNHSHQQCWRKETAEVADNSKNNIDNLNFNWLFSSSTTISPLTNIYGPDLKMRNNLEHQVLHVLLQNLHTQYTDYVSYMSLHILHADFNIRWKMGFLFVPLKWCYLVLCNAVGGSAVGISQLWCNCTPVHVKYLNGSIWTTHKDNI